MDTRELRRLGAQSQPIQLDDSSNEDDDESDGDANSGGGGSIGWSVLGLLALLISRKTAWQAEGKVT